MRFWDTSAVVPLLVDEPRSDDVLGVLRRDRDVVVWWATSIECWSALCRRVRDRILTPAAAQQAEVVLGELSGAWAEVLATDEVRGHARRLLRRHPIRTADALQLGAALTWARGLPERHAIMCLDDRLAEAARREGFTVEPG